MQAVFLKTSYWMKWFSTLRHAPSQRAIVLYILHYMVLVILYIAVNRLQNHLKWMVADANTGKTKVLYDETNKYYVDINDE